MIIQKIMMHALLKNLFTMEMIASPVKIILMLIPKTVQLVLIKQDMINPLSNVLKLLIYLI
jgi:hypothetical protein